MCDGRPTAGRKGVVVKDRKRAAAAAILILSALMLAGCRPSGTEEKPEAAETAQTAAEDDSGVIAQGEGELIQDEELFTDEEENYEENLSPDGTPVLTEAYEISDCVRLCGLDGLRVAFTLEPAPTMEDAVVYAKLQKDAKPAGEYYEVDLGDVVEIDLTAIIDGEVDENLSRTGMQVFVGSGGLDPEIENALIRMPKGSTTEVEITYPEDYGYMDLGGKTVTYRIYISSIATAEYPSEEEIAEAMKFLEKINDAANEEIRMQAIKRAIMDNSKFIAYPEKMVRRARAEYERKYLTGRRTVDDFLNETGMTRAEFKKAEDSYASARVKDMLLLEALKEETGITEESSEYGDYALTHTANTQDVSEMLFRTIITANLSRFDLHDEGAE